ncbi:MAG TPA: hypothetical protein VM737_00460 [Gemmatimonadota bacterium]|nr:hypothetical protein [Gemmatimonadota bacterium]
MPAEARFGRLVARAVGVAWLALGCGGGDTSGPDVTAPPAPVAERIDVRPPIPDGIADITGEEDAVEGRATVTVVNIDATQRAGGSAVQVQTVASINGSFATAIPAELGDDLRFTATDEAGNESPPTTIEAGPIPSPFDGVETGAIEQFTFVSGSGGIDLPFPSGAERYAVVVQSLEPSGEQFEIDVTGAEGVRLRELRSAAREEGPVGLEAEIRELERRILPTLPRPPPAAARRLTPAQELGDRDTFRVANRLGQIDILDEGHFDEVVAALRFIGDNTLIYVDVLTPAENLPEATMETIGRRFDDEVYPIDVDAFGLPSDVDGNGRVILLLTPTINALNTAETVEEGAVFLGFFFGIDLLPDPVFNPFSNGADIMYAVIPDPTGEFGEARFPLEVTVDLVTSVFAHELEHLISANQHLLIRNGPLEDTWLDEGLAHMAETLNGFVLQNRLRSALFQNDPQNHPLVGGDDSLERRGAGWLLVHYLADRFGEDILRRLVQTRLTGIANVDQAADRSFPALFHEWSSTLFLDGLEVTADPAFDFPSLDLRAEFELARSRLDPGDLGTYLDLQTRIVGGAGGTASRPLRGTAVAYFEVRAAQSGVLPLVIVTDRSADLQVTVIRIE